MGHLLIGNHHGTMEGVPQMRGARCMANALTISSADIVRAIDIYLALAFPSGEQPRHTPPKVSPDEPLETALSRFIDETGRANDVSSRKRYVLRLGTACYPHAKLVVEQVMDSATLFFSVDTHDQVGVSTLALGQEQWQAIQRENAAVKAQVEDAWYAAGLPTLRRIKELTHKATAAIRSGQATVLVVDDEEDAAQLLCIHLAREGYTVDFSAGGEACVELARTSKPDVVLLDYMMPELSGREVCARLKAMKETSDIPVLLTSYADVDKASLALADDVLKKPFSKTELLARIKALTDQHPA